MLLLPAVNRQIGLTAKNPCPTWWGFLRLCDKCRYLLNIIMIIGVIDGIISLAYDRHLRFNKAPQHKSYAVVSLAVYKYYHFSLGANHAT